MTSTFRPASHAPERLLAVMVSACLLLAATAARGQAPLINKLEFKDCPLPPPCAADGACRPNRLEYGFYQQKWRRWPTEAVAAAAPEDETSILNPVPPIKARDEDRAAPLPSEPADDEPGEGSGVDIELPPLPDLPPALEGGPGPPPPAAADPPPALPPLGPANRQPPRPGGPPLPRGALLQGGPAASPKLLDAPPALPISFTQAQAPEDFDLAAPRRLPTAPATSRRMDPAVTPTAHTTPSPGDADPSAGFVLTGFETTR